MEQASNVFNKGLQLDTHPMVQGNDTLTDCLNGTLITMAGNEAILQNDMGNRRVNNAFLPPGYEPVGMKEYGGVIYIAAYNPITNKSQIGSFPSPQKKIDSIDNKELGGTFDFNKFFDDSNIEINNDIRYLKNDSFLIPITGDTSLHSGDKFAIWSFGLSSLKDKLTNYENTNENGTKVYSPKNRKYTLQIGILNSQNEFVDITKTLSRWKGNQLQNYNDSKSDLFKFNDGYFISDGFENTLDGTIEDTKLIKRRQQMAANTYSYKLVGPMYLKVNLNHIENFNYDIYGEYNRVKKTATLTIEGYITYNCPDGLLKTKNGSSEQYEDFEQGDPTNFNAFMLYNETEKDSSPKYGNTVYDSNSNTYSTKITRTYKNIRPNVENTDLYNYTILVPAIAYKEQNVSCEEQDVYLKGLSVNGQIDLSLFGSGIIDVSEWRFFNDLKEKEEKTYFTTRFNAYPKYNQKFDNLKLIFTNLTDGTDVVEYPEDKSLPLYNGRNTIIIEWNGKFKKNTTYKVSVQYDIIDKSTNEVLETKTINDDVIGDNWKRWFLTTELFNDLYNEVFDFCHPGKEVENKVKEKLQIQLAVDGTIRETKGIRTDLDGNLFTTNNQDLIRYSSETKQTILLTVNDTHSSIESYENYPDYITAKDNIKFRLLKSIKYSIDNGELLDKDSINIDVETKEGTRLTDDDVRREEYENKYLNIQEIKSADPDVIAMWITNNDFYCGKPELSVTNVKNVFSKLSNIIPDSMPRGGYYAGILPNFDSEGGSDDGHFLEVVTRQEKDWLDYLPSNDSHPDTWYRIAQEDENGPVEFDLRIFKAKIFQHFTEQAFYGQMFTYYFPSRQIQYSNNGYTKGNKNARVWWKKLDGTWALFEFLLHKNHEGNNITKEEFIEFIKNKFGDPVYCMYNNYNGATGLFAADNNYIHNLEYSFTLQIYLQFELDGEYSEFINTEDYGNLEFRATIPTTFTKKCSDISIKSNSNYQDTVNTFNPSNISNIYLDIDKNSEVIDFSNTDFAGNKLDINKIYYIYDDGKLYDVDNPKVKVDFNQQVNGKNVLLYNNNTTEHPIYYQIDVSGSGEDNHSLTRLMYKDAFTIVKPLNDYAFTNY